jgi:hypothetical protein
MRSSVRVHMRHVASAIIALAAVGLTAPRVRAQTPVRNAAAEEDAEASRRLGQLVLPLVRAEHPAVLSSERERPNVLVVVFDANRRIVRHEAVAHSVHGLRGDRLLSETFPDLKQEHYQSAGITRVWLGDERRPVDVVWGYLK